MIRNSKIGRLRTPIPIVSFIISMKMVLPVGIEPRTTSNSFVSERYKLSRWVRKDVIGIPLCSNAHQAKEERGNTYPS